MFIHGQYCYIHYTLPQNSSYPNFYAISNVNLSYENTLISVTIGYSFPLRIGYTSVLLQRVCKMYP